MIPQWWILPRSLQQFCFGRDFYLGAFMLDASCGGFGFGHLLVVATFAPGSVSLDLVHTCGSCYFGLVRSIWTVKASYKPIQYLLLDSLLIR